MVTTAIGLTSAQVQERRARGEGNQVKQETSRSYKDIFIQNIFGAVNVVLYVIGAGLALVGDFKSAFATVALVLFNAAVGIFQEIRAKRQLDQIALLARAQVTVQRDGNRQEIDPSELVLGDVFVTRAGDLIPVDGRVIGAQEIQVDESALTGESDLILKTEGDSVLSGTTCVTGEALIEATQVGESSFANKLTENARKYTEHFTPLQRNVNRLLRIVLAIVVFFSVLAVMALFVLDLTVQSWLQILAVITGSVSAGLLALITLNYSWSAMRIGQAGGLVQQINAVESLSNVTVLCTDKTGTLTTNEIRYNDVFPIEVEKSELERLLGIFAASASSTNKTSEAILTHLPATAGVVVDEVPFSSANKWSALAFLDPEKPADADPRGVYVLGAMEMLEPYMQVPQAARETIARWSAAGLRVLVFAGNRDTTMLHDASGEPQLPPLTLLGVLSLGDTLRPHLADTVAAFDKHGIELKVISGDNPETVAALARQAGIPGELKSVSGTELAQMSAADFAQTSVDARIFGRITPQQKEALVDALRNRGEYVAMIGDGVNDVLSLKKADIGIAMGSGSTATRSVAAMVLLGDSFELLPHAFTEGQRTVNSIQEILRFFMTTVFALLLLIIGIGLLGIGFPFTTLQSTLVSFFARGAPPFVLAVTATAGLARRSLIQNIVEFTLPASLLIFLFGLLIYVGAYFAVENQILDASLTQADIVAIGNNVGADYSNLDPDTFRNIGTIVSAQTALTTFFVLVGSLLMLFSYPPVPWLAALGEYRGRKWLPTIIAAILIVAYIAVLMMPRLRRFFDLIPLSPALYVGIVIMTLVWAAVQLVVWRSNVFERFLDIEWNPVKGGERQ